MQKDDEWQKICDAGSAGIDCALKTLLENDLWKTYGGHHLYAEHQATHALDFLLTGSVYHGLDTKNKHMSTQLESLLCAIKDMSSTYKMYEENGPYVFTEKLGDREQYQSNPRVIDIPSRITCLERRQVGVPTNEKLECYMIRYSKGGMDGKDGYKYSWSTNLNIQSTCRIIRPHKESGWHPDTVDVLLYSENDYLGWTKRISFLANNNACPLHRFTITTHRDSSMTAEMVDPFSPTFESYR